MRLISVLLALCARGASGSCRQGAPAEVVCADDLPEESVSLLQTRVKVLTRTKLMADGSDSSRDAATPLDVRPSVGVQPTVVKFEMLAKKLYGSDFKAGTVTADLVLTLQWVDNRTASLIPQGRDALTLSQERAAKEMWMPNVFLTNQDLGGTQVISTSVTVSSGGTVEKVQRLLARVMFDADIRLFPFDSQSFRFRVASTSLMADELRLQPMSDQGVGDGIIADGEFDVVSVGTRVFHEKEGSLEKSRGELVIQVRRVSGPYIKNLLVPAMLLVAVSYGAFLFPLAAPFIMPRVATTMVSFMAFLVLAGRVSETLPKQTCASWVDLFFGFCVISMFTSLFLNILLEIVEHKLGQPENASKMQHELMGAVPVMDVLVMCICFLWTDGTQLWWLDFWTKLVWFGLLALYLGRCTQIVAASWHEAEAAEPK